MQANRLAITTNAVIPLMAALPYAIIEDEHDGTGAQYDPDTQLTVFAGGRNYSTCRVDESVGGILSKSRSDTQKDD